MTTNNLAPHFTLESVEWNDPRAQEMRQRMDEEMTARYRGETPESPEIIAKRARALAIDPKTLVATLLAVADDGRAVGHVALRRFGDEWEIKRLIVDPTVRRAGLGRRLLAEAHRLAALEGAERVILQAGDRQPDAVALYESLGYTPIAIYGDYAETMPNSRCFEKLLDS